MAKLTSLMKQTGNHSQRRFLSQADMSIIKHDASVEVARNRRGLGRNEKNAYISVCGCGVVGCAIHSTYTNR